MDICIDFDGTVVTHEYPKIGRSVGAEPVLRSLVESGHRLILFTMRSGNSLNDACKWFTENEITLYGIQNNPQQFSWTQSPKAYAQMYIDDAALGCPLIYPGDGSRPYVNWGRIKILLYKLGALTKNKK